jgi:hypothetical protein
VGQTTNKADNRMNYFLLTESLAVMN